jgi:DNA-binding transcriptional MerR regulator
MGLAAVDIPEKLFFKIGEVCDIVGVQAHVLRYWETEFPMFSPQKNRAGQRTYRKRDVEIGLRIKELLYVELYTIAGAKKKLLAELKSANKLKSVETENQIETFTKTVSPQPQYTPEPEPPQKPQSTRQTYERDYYQRENYTPPQTPSISYRKETRSEVTRLPVPEKKTSQANQPSMSKLAFELRELLAMMDANDAELKKLNRRR